MITFRLLKDQSIVQEWKVIMSFLLFLNLCLSHPYFVSVSCAQLGGWMCNKCFGGRFGPLIPPPPGQQWDNPRKWLERGVTPGTSPSLIQCRPSALSWHADQRIRPRRRHRVKSRLEKGKGMQGRWGTCLVSHALTPDQKASRHAAWGPHTSLHYWQLVSRGHSTTIQCLHRENII